MRYAGKEPFPPIHQDSREDGRKYELVSKSQLKKVQKIWVREQYKSEDKRKKLLEDEDKRLKNLEESKTIILYEDVSLPSAVLIKIRQGVGYRDRRVKLFGWVHRLRRQGTTSSNEMSFHKCHTDVISFTGKALMFVTLRDGTGFLQCVLNDVLCQTYDALTLSTEASVQVSGILKTVPEGKNVL